VLGAVVVTAFLLFTLIDLIINHQFKYMEFGSAVGIIFTGIGINLKLKENTEPN
jgi:hypothetical protein